MERYIRLYVNGEKITSWTTTLWLRSSGWACLYYRWYPTRASMIGWPLVTFELTILVFIIGYNILQSREKENKDLGTTWINLQLPKRLLYLILDQRRQFEKCRETQAYTSFWSTFPEVITQITPRNIKAIWNWWSLREQLGRVDESIKSLRAHVGSHTVSVLVVMNLIHSKFEFPLLDTITLREFLSLIGAKDTNLWLTIPNNTI